jgi:cell division protein FtsB
MRTLVAGAKKTRRTERQRISGSLGDRALFWVTVLTLILLVFGLWVLAMVWL